MTTKTKNIQTNLLGRKVRFRELPPAEQQWAESNPDMPAVRFAGKVGTISSVYLSDGTPYYTIEIMGELINTHPGEWWRVLPEDEEE